MSWNSHDPHASKCSTGMVPHNCMYGTQFSSYPSTTPPPNDPSFPANITPIENYMPCNNTTKTLPQVPNDPDTDPSLSNSSALDSFHFLVPVCYKQRRHRRKKHWRLRHKNYPIEN